MGRQMAWTAIARAEHDRDGLRFPSGLTEREWALISLAKHGDRLMRRVLPSQK